uniref:Mannose-P-dolichol utilization defect 1 protein homolog (Trinotate prediction) n=1 Tax=Henneguya salminicola TaxID=69463 RepID=A0A6G3MIH7_HENSL
MAKILSQLFVDEQCKNSYYISKNFIDVSCIGSLITKIIGSAILVGSFSTKIPQIAVVFRNWSTLGLNSLSVLLEIIAGIILIFYCLISEFTILSYGESINILIQNMLLLYLTLIVDKRMKEIFLFTSLLVVAVSLFLANAFTKNILFVIYMYFSFPLSMIGKVI